MSAVVVEGLVKRYGELAAVDGLTFTIDTHDVVAVLGPNGAGKTTAVEILEGFRRADAGRVSVLGTDPQAGGRAFRERIGIVLQEAGFEEEFTARELIRLHAGYYPHPRPVTEVIELVGLEEKADARIKTLSGGQRRRLDLALGIIGDPELLFLDEPTTGFDPTARRRAWDLVGGLRDLGATILLTTHYLDEAEHLADRVLIVNHGRLVAEGTPADLAAQAGVETVVAFRLPEGVALGDLPIERGRCRVAGTMVELRTPTATADVHVLTGWAMDRGTELADLTLTRPSLEDVYLDLVTEPGDGAAAAPSDRRPPEANTPKASTPEATA